MQYVSQEELAAVESAEKLPSEVNSDLMRNAQIIDNNSQQEPDTKTFKNDMPRDS